MGDQDIARQNVKRLLRLRGMSVKGLAEASGLAASTLYNWYRDTDPTQLGQGALSVIAEILEIDIEHLFQYNLQHVTPTDEQARARILRQIDAILGGIDDPQEQDRAGALILATLRAYQDGYERQRTTQPGPRRAGPSLTPGPSARNPNAQG